MKKPRFPGAGSFVAGLLIGASILILAFAMLAAHSGDRQVLWIFAASTVLTLGFLLQTVVIATPWHPHERAEAAGHTYQIHGV